MNKADRTRQYIVEKTAALFNMKGYAGTSLSDITQATGLTKGSIYGNFANKDEVALAAFECNLSKLEEIVHQEMLGERSNKNKLLAYVRVYSNCMRPPFPEGGCPILDTATEADDTHPLLKAGASAALVNWKNKIAGLVRSGIANHEFKDTVDPARFALSIIAMIEGGIMISRLTGNANYRKLIAGAVEELILSLE